MLRFSIIINTYNRGSHLNDAILGLSELDYPDYEVIVIDGPSTDNTEEVLAGWRDRIKIGKCDQPNLSMSRNVGIQMASGDIVAFIDDDAVPHPQWLKRLAVHYADPGVGGAGGFTIDNTGVRYQVRKTVCDRFGNAFFPNDYFDERQLSFPGSPFYPSLLGTNSTFRLSSLREIGGFDHVFAYLLDETDICLRLTDRGYKIVYEPNALVYHQFAPSHIRSRNRIAKTLYPSAVSKSYFIHRHGGLYSESRAREEHVKYEQEILRSNKWLYDHGDITMEHRAVLDDDLLFGMREGTHRAMEKLVAGNVSMGDMDLDAPQSPYLRMQGKEGLRIVLLSRSFPPAVEGGIARWTLMMARGLADRGHKVHVVTLAGKEPSTKYNNGYWLHAICEDHSEEGKRKAALAGIPDGLSGWCFAAYKMVQSLKTFGIDVVSFPIWDVEGIMLADDNSIGVVMSLHTSYAMARPFKPEWTERPLFAHFHVERIIRAETRMLTQVSCILGNSQAIVRDIENTYSVQIADKTTIAPHGTFEPTNYRPDDVARKVAEDRRGKPLRITYVGRFEARKGFDLACDAFRRILQQVPDVEIHIVGDDDHSREVLATDREHVLRSDHRVTFHGTVTRKELDRYYFESDVVVMPSRYESFGLVAIEAMAAGTPVVALAAGGLAEVVEEGASGYLLPANTTDGEAIAEILMALSHDPALLARMKASARAAYETRFTLDQMVAAAEPVYYAAARGAQ